jgi:sugar O-acyltransferase (sialic acid O-acetyltransferase NeuD family)
MNKVGNILIGYSGHAFVAMDILTLSGFEFEGYCDSTEKLMNPYDLTYLGKEIELGKERIVSSKFFIGIGDNLIRRKVSEFIQLNGGNFLNAIHPSAVVSSSAGFGSLCMIAAGVCINPLVVLGNGVICNTSSGVDHECVVGDFSHIGPGAVLCGNVNVGDNCFIGANAVVKQGVRIGNNCIIGAGAVVLSDVLDGSIVFGNPAKPK